MDLLLHQLSDPVASAQTLEDLTRPLLEMLEAVTGMESTCLTTIGQKDGVQRILFARNTKQLTIPEGLCIPWADTLCKRALEENRIHTDDVAARWGDSDSARQLGIQTYVSTPVETTGGAFYGTLCAASSARRPLSADGEKALKLFSRLIGQYVERELLIEQLKKANADLAASALTDPLTELPNRRALVDELKRMLARGGRAGAHVLVGLINLDGFKAINDRHGHEVGDVFLGAMARRISAGLRETDFLARLGGDEFVVIGPGPAPGDAAALAANDAARSFERRLTQSTTGRMQLGGSLVIDYGGASVGVIAIDPQTTNVNDALRQADAAMHEAKRARRAGLGH